MQVPQSFRLMVGVSVLTLAMLHPLPAVWAQENGELQELPPMELPPPPPATAMDDGAGEAPEMPSLPAGAAAQMGTDSAPEAAPDVMPEGLPEESALPDAAMEPPAAMPPATTEAAPAASPPESTDAADGEDVPRLQGSLMFEDDEARNLLAIYRAFQIRKMQQAGQQTPDDEGLQVNADDIIKGLRTQEPLDITEEVLKITLNSILYNNANDWSIWVNGKRYGRKEAMEGFAIDKSSVQVTSITPQRVTYRWTPIEQLYTQVEARWKEKQQLGDLVASPQIAQKDQVALDEAARVVTISMRPNQTFLSRFMTVLEGTGNKVVAKTPPPSADPTAAAVPEGQPENAPQEEEQQGGITESIQKNIGMLKEYQELGASAMERLR
jgi:hypothetical protein